MIPESKKRIDHRTRRFATAILPLSILILQGCLSPIDYEPKVEEEQVSVFDDIDEAEQIALYVDEGVELNRFLMKRVFFDLALIRGAFGGSIEAVEYIRFRPPCSDGRIMVVFEEEAFSAIREGKYVAWSGLNERYQPFEIRLVDKLNKVYLYFDGLYDYETLAGKYAELEGVESASCVGYIGDSPNIYARRTDTGIDYLFRDAWGTCSAGCTGNEFFFFTCQNDDAIYVGAWNPGDGAEPPEWWVQARKCLPMELANRF